MWSYTADLSHYWFETPGNHHPGLCYMSRSFCTSCLGYGTVLWIEKCSHCKESPPSCSDILRALVFVLLHHLVVASTGSYLMLNAYTKDIYNLLLACLHNKFDEEGAHTAGRELQHVTYECPPNIWDNLVLRHFQYTYDSLGELRLDTSYIWNSGRILL